MSPQERQIMRQREAMRREQIQRETEAALRDSGLRLAPDERGLFESRYMQERRKMEQTLRQQIETERQQQLPALIQQLKREFQPQQPNSSTTVKPTQSPKSGTRQRSDGSARWGAPAEHLLNVKKKSWLKIASKPAR